MAKRRRERCSRCREELIRRSFVSRNQTLVHCECSISYSSYIASYVDEHLLRTALRSGNYPSVSESSSANHRRASTDASRDAQPLSSRTECFGYPRSWRRTTAHGLHRLDLEEETQTRLGFFIRRSLRNFRLIQSQKAERSSRFRSHAAT